MEIQNQVKTNSSKDKFDEDIFIDMENIPDSFIHFRTVDVSIGRARLTGNKIVFALNKGAVAQKGFSNVDIYERRNGEFIKIATFYNWYSYTRGFMALINEKLGDYVKIVIVGENNHPTQPNSGCKLQIYVYVCKNYLLNNLNNQSFPKLLHQILRDKEYKPESQMESYKKLVSTQSDNISYPLIDKSDFKRDPFNYQIKNMQWMCNMEMKIDSGKMKLTTYELPDSEHYLHYIDVIKEYLLVTPEGECISLDSLPRKTIDIRGGLLADSIGLGKTFSMIGLIYKRLNKNNMPTLIVTPNSLCKQWEEEIIKSCDLNAKIISSITQFKKLTLEKLREFDVIIISYRFFIGKNYVEYCNSDTCDTDILLHNVKWERLILDEAHEYINDNTNIPNERINTYLHRLQSNYKWICSGTPYTQYEKSWLLLSFLANMYKLYQSPIGLSVNPLEYNNYPYGVGPMESTVPVPAEMRACWKYVYSRMKWKDEHNFTRDTNEVTPIWNRSKKKYEKKPPHNNDNVNSHYYLHRKYKHILDNLVGEMFRRNTKESVDKEVSIPEPIIENTFLNMNEIERIIYDSALNNKKKQVELCNHVMVSDEHVNILGNKPMTLEDIHCKMTQHYQKSIEKNTKKLENTIIAIEKAQEKEDEKLIEDLNKKKGVLNENINLEKIKLNIFTELDSNKIDQEDCPICMESLQDLTKTITPCGHLFCANCITCHIRNKKSNIGCPYCRQSFAINELEVFGIKKETEEVVNQLGTKLTALINYLKDILLDENNRVIVFSQWDSMLKMISKIFEEKEIKFLFLDGSLHVVNNRIQRFKLDPTNRVVLLSSDKSVSGLTLTEANHIILLDTLNHETKEMAYITEQQAIGRAVRIGQQKRVNVRRFIMRNTIEHDYYLRNIGVSAENE